MKKKVFTFVLYVTNSDYQLRKLKTLKNHSMEK